MAEMWREIAGFAGYEISDRGRVKNCRGKILTPVRNNGYYQINLSKGGKKHKRFIHRLVAEAFIPNPLGLPQVNHVSGIKSANYSENLEWVTPGDNQKHAYATGLRIKKLGTDSHKSDSKIYTFYHPEQGTLKSTQYDMRVLLGVSPSTVGKLVRGKMDTCKGWKVVKSDLGC